jgi:hypothetical protein
MEFWKGEVVVVGVGWDEVYVVIVELELADERTGCVF